MLKPTIYIPSWLTRLATPAPNDPETIVRRRPTQRLAGVSSSGRIGGSDRSGTPRPRAA